LGACDTVASHTLDRTEFLYQALSKARFVGNPSLIGKVSFARQPGTTPQGHIVTYP